MAVSRATHLPRIVVKPGFSLTEDVSWSICPFLFSSHSQISEWPLRMEEHLDRPRARPNNWLPYPHPSFQNTKAAAALFCSPRCSVPPTDKLPYSRTRTF